MIRTAIRSSCWSLPRDEAGEALRGGSLVAVVVFLRGVNVGGYRTFRPTELMKQLKHLDAVNIGAAGTFVIRKPISQSQLRAELASRLPFETEMMICKGSEIVRLMS